MSWTHGHRHRRPIGVQVRFADASGMPPDYGETAGGSARAEHERRRDARLARHRSRFGRLGGITARIDGESQAERNWRRGAEGEERVGCRLEKLLKKRGIAVLHDLSIPGSSANIDHACVGPGGVTVIDAKRYAGKVRIRRKKLRVGGSNRTSLVEGVKKQIEVVRGALASEGLADTDIRGALCWVEDGGLPTFWHLSLDGVRIAWTRRCAKLARRRGDLSQQDINLIAAVIAAKLPPHRA